jgi:hypothetical protein
MRKKVFFLLILTLSIFYNCSRKQVEALPESSPCNLVEFVLPENSYEKPNEYRISFTYYDYDRAKKNADSIINISLSEKSNIDSLFLVLDNYEASLLNDSLENEKWVGICMKISQMPLNTFLKIACNFQVKKTKYWLLDFRYDELTVYLCNKQNFPTNDSRFFRNFKAKEYTEYLKNADYDALKKIEDLTKNRNYRYSFRTKSLEDYIPEYLTKSAETITNFYWNNNDASLQQLDSLENLISDFKNKYQKTLEIQQSDTLINCNRKAFSIHFDKNISLAEIIRIINIPRKYELIFDVDCVENRLNICTLCSKDETRKFNR